MSLLRKLFICPKPPSGGASGQTPSPKDTDIEKNPSGGADTSSEADGSLEMETECAVCQDRLNEPCTIPCGNQHVFCLACLKGLTTHSAHRNHFLCPLCRKRVRVPFGGVSAFRNHKTLVQVLRSKLPDLRPWPRRRRRRRRSRSGMRSTDYLTVSFPVLAYPNQLELDILTSLYARREAGQPDRLLEAILGEINQRPSRPRDQNAAMWVSEDLVASEDSDQDDEVSDLESPAALGRNPPSSEEPGLMNVDDLDMSVVLQIIADMEENERRREASRGMGLRATTGCAPSQRAEACGVTPWRVEISNGRPQRPENLHTSLRPENIDTSQRLENVHTPLIPKTANTTLMGLGADSTTVQRSETSNDKSQRPESVNATSQQQETCNADPQRLETSNATPQRLETSHVQPRRSEPATAKSQRSESGNSESPRRQTGHAKSHRPETDKLASQRSRTTAAASVKQDIGDAAPKRLGITEVPQRPDIYGSSSHRSEIGQLSSGRSSVGNASVPDTTSSSHALRQSVASARTERSNSSNAYPQKPDRRSTEVAAAARSSSPQQSLSESSANNPKDPRPVGDQSENAPERKDADSRDYKFMPRPRMGSFKLAIAAGQKSPTSDEDSPPLFASPQRQTQVSEADSGVTKDSAQSSVQRNILSKSRYKTKTEIGERPMRIKYHPRPTSNADSSFALEQRNGEDIVRMMDGADRDSEDQLTAVMDSGERCHAQEKERIRTSSQNPAEKNSYERHPQTDMSFQKWCDRDQSNTRSVNEDLPTPCRSDTSQRISQASHPELRPQVMQKRDGRRHEHSKEQAPGVPLTTSDGFLSKQRRLQERSSEPSRSTMSSSTMSSSELRKKRNSNQTALMDNEVQEEARVHSVQRARADKDLDDSEEWTRRIRGLQRRVMSQTRNRSASKDAHRAADAPDCGVSPTRRSRTSSSQLADDGLLVMDTEDDNVDVFHV